MRFVAMLAIVVGTTIFIQVLPVGLGYALIAIVFIGITYYLSDQIEKLNKTIAEQQNEIADLKRELEEGKGKMEKGEQ